MQEHSNEIARILTKHKLNPTLVSIDFQKLHPKLVIAIVRQRGTLLGSGQGSTREIATYDAMANRRLRRKFSPDIQDRFATLVQRLVDQQRLIPHFRIDSWGDRDDGRRWNLRLCSGDLLLAQASASSLDVTMRQLIDSAHNTLSSTPKLLHLITEVGAERGAEGERRVQAVVERLRSEISWITAVRQASEHEEAKGIDLIVETDQGNIHLQVKSSLSGREAFLRSSNHDPAILVIVADEEATEETLERDLSILLRHRYAALLLRPSYPST